MTSIKIIERIKCFDCDNFIKVVCCGSEKKIKCEKYGLIYPCKFFYVECPKLNRKISLLKCSNCEFNDKFKRSINDVECRYMDYLKKKEKEEFNERVNKIISKIDVEYKNIYITLQKIKWNYGCDIIIERINIKSQRGHKSLVEITLVDYNEIVENDLRRINYVINSDELANELIRLKTEFKNIDTIEGFHNYIKCLNVLLNH